MTTPPVRELQVTPMPDTIDAPGFGFLPLGSVPSSGGSPLAAGLRALGWLSSCALLGVAIGGGLRLVLGG